MTLGPASAGAASAVSATEVRTYLAVVTPLMLEVKAASDRADKQFAEPDQPGTGKVLRAVGRSWERMARRFAAVRAPRRLVDHHREAADAFRGSARVVLALAAAHEEFERTQDENVLARAIEAGSDGAVEDARSVRAWARAVRTAARAGNVPIPRWLNEIASSKLS
jgi:hypothetical protein